MLRVMVDLIKVMANRIKDMVVPTKVTLQTRGMVNKIKDIKPTNKLTMGAKHMVAIKGMEILRMVDMEDKVDIKIRLLATLLLRLKRIIHISVSLSFCF